ncbi:conjugal transfer protein TraC [Ensifer sp. BR816]|uniref:conjugal transfer protein TraC n=1 Tax=Rhizobium sp. (strain BR816) TaxID=1057002 RepID=UPI0003686E37|nr:conjugal transfer protein TraC [Ensifer sp. BR816]
MKKPSAKIREEIARLQEQLKAAETREAERIGRVALKAGLGDIEIDEADLQAAFEQVAQRFRGGNGVATGKRHAGDSKTAGASSTKDETGPAQSGAGEA